MERFTMNEDSAIGFLIHHGLIRASLSCKEDKCGREMVLMKNGPKAARVWKCKHHPDRKVSYRTGSILEGTKIKSAQFIQLLCLWAQEMQICQVEKFNTGLSCPCIIKHYKIFRSTCQWWIEKNPYQIGGPGVEVQVKETILRNMPRNQLKPELWGFVSYCPSQNKGYICLLSDHETSTIQKIIKERIAPGSEIHHHDKNVFKDIDTLPVEPAYTHKILHATKEGPLDPKTGESTMVSDIDLYISDFKQRLFFEMSGTIDCYLSGYLSEYLWRRIYGKNHLKALCNLIKHLGSWYKSEGKSLQAINSMTSYKMPKKSNNSL